LSKVKNPTQRLGENRDSQSNWDIKHFKMEEWTWDCGGCYFFYVNLNREIQFKPNGSKVGGKYTLKWWRDDEWLLWRIVKHFYTNREGFS